MSIDKALLPPQRPKDRFLVFGAPLIEDAEIQEVVDCLKSGWLGTGPKVARFEEEFRKYKRAHHAVALNSCTAALHLSLLVAGVGPGDEVITTALTFCATVNAIIHAGATPVLADVDPRTLNIDPREIVRKITARTRAIVPVHFAGRPCDMDGILDLARRHALKIVEDCAHAAEAEYRGQPVGTFGDFGCFSFYATKNIATGEGGMVLARREEDAARMKTLALHGMSKDAWKRFSDDGYRHYQVVEAGFKYNMMDLQAAIGLHQLARVETAWRRRREIWDRYQSAFSDLPVVAPPPPELSTRHSFHLYSILIDPDRAGMSRDEFLGAMTAQNIGIGVHYVAIPEHPFYRDRFGWQPDDYPHAVRTGRQTVSLPLSAKLSDADVDDVVAAVRRTLGYPSKNGQRRREGGG
ncbi:MAG: DegT/DnrJ/EryC1/StrS family aminotransferase [Planctomycetia bacterium]|nr:DegT/DnrJ/EryC1/StrS family aminotransferase [Planctomycetia bacterium]